MSDDLLLPMYEDDYYCNNLIDKIKVVLQHFAVQIKKVDKLENIHGLANDAVQKINRLKPLFEENECSLDDVAADYIAEAMMMVVENAGYFNLDIQELMAYKEF